jgi:hypothetical protein
MWTRGRRGRPQMVVGFTTTCAISAYHHSSFGSVSPAHGEVYPMQQCAFPAYSGFPPPIKLIATI